MDFEEYKQERYVRWQKYILKFCFISSIIILIVELAIFAVMASFNFLEGKMLLYPLIRIAIPSGANFLTNILCFLIYDRKIFKNKTFDMNFIVMINIIVVSGVVATFHCFFLFLLVCTIAPFFLCTIFADIKLLQRIGNINFFFLISSCVSVYIDAFTGNLGLKIVTLICYIAVWVVSYFFSQTLVKTQIDQINMIYSSYQKQTQLIEELKIEPMTHLYNKTCLEQCLNAYVRKFAEGVFHPSVVIIDIDHFKLVNDTYGHSAGDEVLIKLADIIKDKMGGIRHSFRFGGEEFVITFENEDKDFVVNKIQSIKDEFTSCRFSFASDKIFSFSAGISFMNENLDRESWFNTADSALYNAKNTGRNRIEIA